MSRTNSQSVRTRYHRVVDETLKSIVLEVTLPGTRVKETIRVPKKLCRNWTKDTVDIYSGYYANGVTKVNVTRRASTDEFDEVQDDGAEVLQMPVKCTVEHKQWIVDEVMTAYTSYERLGVA